MNTANTMLVIRVALVLSGVSAQQALNLTLIHINDHHSHVDENSLDLFADLIPPGLSVNTSQVRMYYGGAPRTSALIKGLQEEAIAAGDEVCLLHAGDALTGTLFYTFFGPVMDAAIMNEIGFDAFVPGNHEFDNGDTNLADFVRELSMPVLSYNLNPAPESELSKLGDSSIQPYLIKTLENGDRFGICGITTKISTELSSFPDEGTTLQEEAESATACVADLQAESINKIILLTHIGLDEDRTELASIEGVDVIVGGHSHSLLGGDELSAFGLEPMASYSVIENGVCIVTAWEYAKVVGRLDIQFDAEGNVLSCQGQPFFSINPDRFTVRDAEEAFDLSESDTQIMADYLLDLPMFVDYGEDQEIIDILAPFRNRTEELSTEVIATVPENICHTRGGEIDEQCPGKELQSQVGGGVCHIVAYGFLYNIPTADFAIQNAGGCRTDILAGDFTFGNAFEVLPFANTLVTFQMTGDQIRLTLEDAFNFFLDPDLGGGSGSYPIGAGLRWHVDYTMPFGERVTNIEMLSTDDVEWEALDLSGTYEVVSNSFVAGGRDGYFQFGMITDDSPELYVDTYVEYAQSLVNYVRQQKVIVDPPISSYSTQVLVLEDGTTIDLREASNAEATNGDGTKATNGAGDTSGSVASFAYQHICFWAVAFAGLSGAL